MWTETYDYVRLHQPHRMFTAGNIPWQPSRPPAYLAARGEVLEHISACLAELRERVELVERYGYAFESLNESADGVELACRSVAHGTPLVITAERCVKAFGFRVPRNEPLAFSTRAVVSVAPTDPALGRAGIADDAAPIVIVGGGKTGMDTAHTLLKRYPGREITLVVGNGTIFASRDESFPAGIKRWWGSATTLEYFLDLCMAYDGTNGTEIFERFKSERSVHLPETGSQYMFGVLSRAENDAIANGVTEIVRDYLEDIIDTAAGPEMVFRSGARRTLASGAIVVNCTGYVMRQDYPYEPYLSAGGRVVSVQPTSSIHFLTTFAAYFLVHLFYLGELGRLPLYELNYQALLRKDKVAFPFVAMTQVLYNVLQIIDAVPANVMSECGLDFDRWFPLPRRLLGAVKLKRGAENYRNHFRKSLDTVAERYGVECGLLATHASA